jgi:predicted metal-dependent hydrolase
MDCDSFCIGGDPALLVRVRRHAGARRISLRVGGVDGQISLTLPPRAALSQAIAFAHSREGWLRAALARRPRNSRPAAGLALPVLGVAHVILAPPGRGAARLGEGQLILPGPPETVPQRAASFLRVLARDRLVQACDHHATRLGRRFRAIALRDTRARWGSCAADGTLRFSWRLAMAPPEVLDYVAAHEVAHLAQMNHSPAFWAEVARLKPGWQAQRAWLRTHGAELQRWDFGRA